MPETLLREECSWKQDCSRSKHDVKDSIVASKIGCAKIIGSKILKNRVSSRPHLVWQQVVYGLRDLGRKESGGTNRCIPHELDIRKETEAAEKCCLTTSFSLVPKTSARRLGARCAKSGPRGQCHCPVPLGLSVGD